MDASTVELLKELFGAILPALKLGPLAIIGTGVLFSLRLLKHFAPRYWESLPALVKLVLPFAVAALGTFLAGIGSLGLLPALGAAFAAGLGAIGLHHTSKALGAELEVKVPLTPLREHALALILDKKALPKNVIVLSKERL